MRNLELSIQRDLKQIAKELSKVKEIVAVILYGSHARGDAGPRSDIDIFVICDTEKNMRKLEPKITTLLHRKTKRFVQPLCVSVEDLGDPGIAAKIFREGKVLFVKEPLLITAGKILDARPYRLLAIPISALSQKEKVKFNTALYGKKVKNYKYKGLLDEVSGAKFGRGTILVPEEKVNKIIKFCKSYNIKPKEVKVWVEEIIE